MIEYLVGVDGGGTGTRVRIECMDGREIGRELGRGFAGPSGLRNGADVAWAAILDAINLAFNDAEMKLPLREHIAVGMGLAGVHNKQWADAFVQQDPGFGAIALETDAYCTLLGAHLGQPGAVIAIGTGSVGEALLEDGTRREVGGWGFPCGDDGSGAWLGLRASNHAQHVLDGCRRPSEFASAIIAASGGDRDGMLIWLGNANQTAYAQLAPIVIQHAAHDEVARALMIQAGKEIAEIGAALDPAASLPIALGGGLAAPMCEYLPEQMRSRIVQPKGDAMTGALLLIRKNLKGKQ
jgi:glucosamine kinase